MTKTKMNTLLATTAVLALAACGGSGDGTAANPTVSFTTAKQFADGGGVATGVRSDGARSVFISPDIAEVVQAANSTSQEDLTDINRSDFPIVQVLPSNANMRQGAMTVDGIVFNVTVFEDLGDNSQVALLEIPNSANAIISGGSPLGTIPTGGFTYSGTLGTGLRDIDPQIELGNFTMNTNFNNGTFSFNGSTLSDTLVGNGFIDVNNGSLSSNNLSLTTSGTSRTATMYGNFHGGSAQGVSGLFHSNEANPTHSGGFAGSRE